jgi:hypothetical protein
MRKLMIIAAALATLGGSAIPPADAEMVHHPIHGIVVHPHPGCWGPHCIHGIVIHPHPGCWGPHCIHGIILHRVCVAWEVFGGERHCVRWRNVP